jgi:hypothetical protein
MFEALIRAARYRVRLEIRSVPIRAPHQFSQQFGASIADYGFAGTELIPDIGVRTKGTDLLSRSCPQHINPISAHQSLYIDSKLRIPL